MTSCYFLHCSSFCKLLKFQMNKLAFDTPGNYYFQDNTTGTTKVRARKHTNMCSRIMYKENEFHVKVRFANIIYTCAYTALHCTDKQKENGQMVITIDSEKLPFNQNEQYIQHKYWKLVLRFLLFTLLGTTQLIVV